MAYSKSSLLIGFSVWAVATLIFRGAGQYFFLPENLWITLALWLVTPIFLAGIALWLFKKHNLKGSHCLASAAFMVIPGMIADAFCIQFFAIVFPNLPDTAAAPFGAWLMWAYVSVLILGVLKSLQN